MTFSTEDFLHLMVAAVRKHNALLRARALFNILAFRHRVGVGDTVVTRPLDIDAARLVTEVPTEIEQAIAVPFEPAPIAGIWQPIATIADNHGDHPVDLWINYRGQQWRICGVRWAGQGWFDGTGAYTAMTPLVVTHWMPIPPPPTYIPEAIT